MAVTLFVLFAGETTWRIGVGTPNDCSIIDVPLPVTSSPTVIATLVAKAMNSAGYRGEGVLLALPSYWCLSSSIDTRDLPANDRKAMLFRLEEKLPLAAEAVVADFVAGADQTSLGVCARLDVVAPLIDALETAGIAVQHVSPATLLAAQATEAGDQRSQSARILLCDEDQTSLSIIVFDTAGQPLSWSMIPAHLADLKLQTDVITARLTANPQIDAIGVSSTLLSELTQATDCPVTAREESTQATSMRAASEIISGAQRPWIEFRRGPLAVQDKLRLYRKPLDALLVAAAVFLLAVALVLVVRAGRYGRQEQSFDQQMVDGFRTQFPGWTIPANVKAVIDSEHRKSVVAAGSGVPAEARASALATMHAVLSRLPTDGRYAIDHLTFEDASFEITGRLHSYEQADALASAGRRGGFDVPPPQTRRNDDGSWTFTLRGTRTSKAPLAAAVAKGGAD